MSTCFLNTISNCALCPLRKITVLSLDFNPLNGAVLHDAFYGLHGTPLRELHLSSVNFGNFSQPLFEGMNDNDITTIDLRNSLITTTKRGVFRNLGKLNKLVLSDSKITTIEDHSFEDLVSLSNLNLDNNNIVELPSAKRLGITPELLRLSMNHNSIKGINQESLLGYDNLTALLLGGNNIRTISANAFAPTPRLKVLVLFNNKIMYIRSGTFDTLPDLRKLLLYRNFIHIDNPSLFQVCRANLFWVKQSALEGTFYKTNASIQRRLSVITSLKTAFLIVIAYNRSSFT